MFEMLLLGRETFLTNFDRTHTVGAHLQRGFLNFYSLTLRVF